MFRFLKKESGCLVKSFGEKRYGKIVSCNKVISTVLNQESWMLGIRKNMYCFVKIPHRTI